MKQWIRGLQHIGIPTNDLRATVAFYQHLGFEEAYRTLNDGVAVVFLRLGELTIETYENGQATGKAGAVDHIALDVTDAEAALEESKRRGHKILDGGLCSLPFWTNGVKFYKIEGPNGEIVEFSQML